MVRTITQSRLLIGGKFALDLIAYSRSPIPYAHIASLAVIGVLTLFANNAVQATPLIDFKVAPNSFVGFSNFTFGYQFTVSKSVVVDGVGVFDLGSDGVSNTLVNRHDVALWEGVNLKTAILMASGTVSPTSAWIEISEGLIGGQIRGAYVYEPISTIELKSGVDYVLGAYYEPNNSDEYAFPGGSVVDNDFGVSLVNARLGFHNVPGQTGIVFPFSSSIPNVGYFGPTLHISSTIPEPGTLLLMIAGIFTISLRQRKIH